MFTSLGVFMDHPSYGPLQPKHHKETQIIKSNFGVILKDNHPSPQTL